MWRPRGGLSKAKNSRERNKNEQADWSPPLMWRPRGGLSKAKNSRERNKPPRIKLLTLPQTPTPHPTLQKLV